MYNRYVPQNDGTWRRSRVQSSETPQKASGIPEASGSCQDTPEDKTPLVEEAVASCGHPRSASPQDASCQPNSVVPCPNTQKQRTPPQGRSRASQPPSAKSREQPIGAFLKNLLPQGFDTGDLLVLVLLLILSGDGPEDRNTALLTLAIYLFL